MKHPLPALFHQAVERTGQYRTLREELAYDFEGSRFRGTDRALVRMTLTLHPMDREYGGTVSFVQDQEDESLRQVAGPIARGIWEALSEFRLKDFALLVHELEVAISGNAEPILIELGSRAVRHALHDASFESHVVPGWVKPGPESVEVEEEPEGPPRPSGAESRAAREARRKQGRTGEKGESQQGAQKERGREGRQGQRSNEQRRDRPGGKHGARGPRPGERRREEGREDRPARSRRDSDEARKRRREE